MDHSSSLTLRRSGRFRGDAAPWLAAAAFGVACAPPPAALAQTERPNIIVILTDDQGAEAIEGPYWPNDLNCHTPNLAHFASQGRVFTNARSSPVCSPTRAAIMTGRASHRTGVTGVLYETAGEPQRTQLSLQPNERTLAEALHDRGYFTLLSDKWHLGWNDNGGVMPEDQGFDEFIDYRDHIRQDRVTQTGDEHISRIVDETVDEIEDATDDSDPYALFFWTIDAHSRFDEDLEDRLLWWIVDDDLLPSGEDYYADDNNRNRYRAVVEALDTELARLLRELGVIDEDGRYNESSNTVVFFLSDNGCPTQVSVDPSHAKNTVYERGVRVPFFVFGEGVPGDGLAVDRLVAAEDLFEAIADVAGISESQRGDAPRDGVSFADAIGWETQGDPVEREHMAFSTGHPDDPAKHRVAITDGRHKLIARAGGANLAPLSDDEFYDLLADPDERDNLAASGMTDAQREIYYRMRDDLSGRMWPSAVSAATPIVVDVPLLDALALSSAGERSTTRLTLGHHDPDFGSGSEWRAFLRFDAERIDALLPHGKSIDDVTAAQIVVGFSGDAAGSANTDTGPIAVHPMLADWNIHDSSWNDLDGAFDTAARLGGVDLPAFIVPNPSRGKQVGVPLSTGTPVSFGHAPDLLDRVRAWHGDNDTNHGVVLIAERLDGLESDQRVHFMNRAVLRLTVD